MVTSPPMTAHYRENTGYCRYREHDTSSGELNKPHTMLKAGYWSRLYKSGGRFILIEEGQ
jgi:hypothetical protein